MVKLHLDLNFRKLFQVFFMNNFKNYIKYKEFSYAKDDKSEHNHLQVLWLGSCVLRLGSRLIAYCRQVRSFYLAILT